MLPVVFAFAVIAPTALGADANLRFLGNSWTFVNDLDQVTLALFAAGLAAALVRVRRATSAR